jgi:hypothetical protein
VAQRRAGFAVQGLLLLWARTSGLAACASQPRCGAPGPPRKREGGGGGGAGKPAAAEAWSFQPGPPRAGGAPAGRLSSRDSPGASSRSSSRQPRARDGASSGRGRPVSGMPAGLAQRSAPPALAAASRGADEAPSAGLPASIHCGDSTGAPAPDGTPRQQPKQLLRARAGRNAHRHPRRRGAARAAPTGRLRATRRQAQDSAAALEGIKARVCTVPAATRQRLPHAAAAPRARRQRSRTPRTRRRASRETSKYAPRSDDIGV